LHNFTFLNISKKERKKRREKGDGKEREREKKKPKINSLSATEKKKKKKNNTTHSTTATERNIETKRSSLFDLLTSSKPNTNHQHKKNNFVTSQYFPSLSFDYILSLLIDQTALCCLLGVPTPNQTNAQESSQWNGSPQYYHHVTFVPPKICNGRRY
jgi:hypothetical protein